jgi:hypothetical protein
VKAQVVHDLNIALSQEIVQRHNTVMIMSARAKRTAVTV